MSLSAWCYKKDRDFFRVPESIRIYICLLYSNIYTVSLFKCIKYNAKKFQNLPKLEAILLKNWGLPQRNTYFFFFLLKYFLLVFFFFLFSSNTVQTPCLIWYHDIYILLIVNFFISKVTILLFFIKKKINDIVTT